MAREAKKSGFMMWYESYQGKKVVNMVYCLGASVVIIGALFKIMHFAGAGPLLMIGMCTEALLFAIGCLDKPHAEFHWQNVFPQLVGYGADPEELKELESKPRPTLLGMGNEGGAVASAAGSDAKKANVPALTDKEFEALKGSISDLAATASQLSEIGKIADKTNKLGEKMEAAGAAADKFIGSQEGLTNASVAFAKNIEVGGATLSKAVEVSANALNEKVNNAAATLTKGVDDSTAMLTKSMGSLSEAIGKSNNDLTNAYAKVVSEMQTVANSSKNFEEQINTTNQKLTVLNSVYELQITAAQAQANAFQSQAAQVMGINQTVQKIQNSTLEAAKAGEEYEATAKQLTKQVADLNKIYGNMLTALK